MLFKFFRGFSAANIGLGVFISFAEYLAACCEDEGEENPP